MISHEDAVKMCEILKRRRADKARQHNYDATSFTIDSINRTKKRIEFKRGGWSSRKSATY